MVAWLERHQVFLYLAAMVLGAALAQRGHAVTVATLWYPGAAKEEQDGAVRVLRMRGTLQRAGALFSDSERRHAPPFPDPELVMQLAALMREVQPDIVHAHNWIVYAYLPLMVFPIFVSLEKLDKRLLEASEDLGASPWATFRQVTLPLSAPGVATGCMLVFILLMGEYLIPALLGGGKVFFIGNALVDLFLQSRNWPFGSAIAVTLVVVVVIVLMIAMRIAWRISGTRQVDLI